MYYWISELVILSGMIIALMIGKNAWITSKRAYLAFKYSTNQKSAVTDVPDVVGSLFNTGMIAIAALAGFAVGAVVTTFISKKKMKAAQVNA